MSTATSARREQPQLATAARARTGDATGSGAQLAITAIGVVAPPRPGLDAFAAALAGPAPAACEDPAPERSPYVLADFDVRAHLGRRGTSTLDRATSLALVACAEALAGDGEEPVHSRDRVGVSLGTTAGSLRSMSDYTLQTLTEERPYLVNPSLFPNTVMNCAAGQLAIRHGLRGINATIAGGDIALFAVLRSASRALALGHLDAVIAGAVEEFSPHRAWQARLATGPAPAAQAGEGAAIFRLERARDVVAGGREQIARIEAVRSGFSPGGELPSLPEALAACARRTLVAAGVAPAEISSVGCRVPTGTMVPEAGREAVEAALGRADARWISVDAVVGDCGAASSALQLAALIARRGHGQAGSQERALLLGWTCDGALAAAVITVAAPSTAAEASK